MCRSTKIYLTTLPINIKDNFYGWESLFNDRFGKTCSPFPSLLPPHKMIFLYTTSLLREGEETANKFLAQTRWLQSHQESTHSAPRGQIFRHFYLFKTREQFILSVHSLFWKSTPSLCIYLSYFFQAPTRPSRSLQKWTAHDSQLGGKILQRISLKNRVKTFLIFRNTT